MLQAKQKAKPSLLPHYPLSPRDNVCLAAVQEDAKIMRDIPVAMRVEFESCEDLSNFCPSYNDNRVCPLSTAGWCASRWFCF